MAGFLGVGVVNLRGVVEIIFFAHHPALFPPGTGKLNVSKVAHSPLHGCLKECFVSGGCEPRSIEVKTQLSFAIKQSYGRQQSNKVSHPQHSGKV
jgi:hypothetical protein